MGGAMAYKLLYMYRTKGFSIFWRTIFMKKLIGLLVVFFIVGSAGVHAEGTPCKVGEIGPGGGYIFFCDNLNDKVLPAGKIGLEAAPSDQKGIRWYNGEYKNTGATATAVGKGLSNTRKIIGSQGERKKAEGYEVYAALSCYSRPSIGGDSDSNWFLPSKDELNLMYENLAKKNNLGNFAHDFYWSSSEFDDYVAWYQGFSNGGQGYGYKGYASNVRCARAF